VPRSDSWDHQLEDCGIWLHVTSANASDSTATQHCIYSNINVTINMYTNLFHHKSVISQLHLLCTLIVRIQNYDISSNISKVTGKVIIWNEELATASGGFNGQPHVQWPMRPQHNGPLDATRVEAL